MGRSDQIQEVVCRIERGEKGKKKKNTLLTSGKRAGP